MTLAVALDSAPDHDEAVEARDIRYLHEIADRAIRTARGVTVVAVGGDTEPRREQVTASIGGYLYDITIAPVPYAEPSRGR